MVESSPKTVQALAHFRQFIQFGMVGGSGVIVNLTVVYLCKKFAEAAFALNEREIFLPLLNTDFNIRWYNVFTIVLRIFGTTNLTVPGHSEVFPPSGGSVD